jgi:hypothetical protein
VLEAGDVVLLEGRFFASFRIHRQGGIDQARIVHAEQDGAVKAVMPRENAGQHRQGLLAAVFLIGGDQHDVFAFSRALSSLIGQPERALRNGMGGCGAGGEREKSQA